MRLAPSCRSDADDGDLALTALSGNEVQFQLCVFADARMKGDPRFGVEYAGRPEPGGQALSLLLAEAAFAAGASPRKFPRAYVTRLSATLPPDAMRGDVLLRRAASDEEFRRAIWWQPLAGCTGGRGGGIVRPMRALLVFLSVAVSGKALAGMPVITLSDVAALRLSGISFFVALILLVAWLVRLLWNYLRRDFQRLPLLNYGRSLALVLLLGLCFNIVLLMISGTRELMTPGAWEKHGTSYQLKPGAK